MAALVTVFVVVVVSLLISRVATVALSLTGMSREAARFQARSALSGVGFTTSEAELVVSHPVRRRIIFALMLIGSAGVVTAVATLILSFSGATAAQTQTRLIALGGGLLAILLLARNPVVDGWLSRVIAVALRRWSDLETRDYAQLLRLTADFGVLELAVRPQDWAANRSLAALSLRDEGIAVLGIERLGGGYVGAPDWSTEVRPGDTLIVYGATEAVCELDSRPHGVEGERLHQEAVARHRNSRGGTIGVEETAAG